MRKKIFIVTVCILVTLLTMTSSLFASMTTNSYNYKFWNKDPLVGTSYGVTYLSNVVGLYTARNMSVTVKIKKADASWTGWATASSPANTYSKYTFSSLSTSKNSDSTQPVSSYHMAGLTDGVSKPSTTVCSSVWCAVREGTTVPYDNN